MNHGFLPSPAYLDVRAMECAYSALDSIGVCEMFALRTHRRSHAPYCQGAFTWVGADRRAQCQRAVERRATREEDRSQPDNLLSSTRYPAGRRLRDVRPDERRFRSHAASAHVERRRVVARPVEPSGASGDVRPTRPGLMAERFRGLRTRFGVDPGEYPPLQSILDSSVHGWPQAIAGAQRAWENHLGCFPTDVAPRNA